MKKIIFSIIATAVILAGCSSGATTGNQSSSNNTTNTNANLLDSIDTANSAFKKGYYDYDGTISNNMPIQMSIYPLEQDIVGSYFYESQRKEIKLKGKAGAKDFILYEYDEAGKSTGIFKGSMKTVDKIEGTWVSPDNKTSYSFTLSLKSNLPGVEFGERYSVAVGTVSDNEVESFASKIQGYIINDKKEQISDLVAYPITVKINGKATAISTKDQFIKNYSLIFNSNYKEAISKAFTKYMFANWQGVMFGQGQYNMWINTTEASKLMIKAINN